MSTDRGRIRPVPERVRAVRGRIRAVPERVRAVRATAGSRRG